MRNLFLLSSILAPLAASAVPTSVTWQARLTDAQGAPLAGSHAVTLKLYSVTETVLWSKQYASVPVDGGYVSVVLSGAGDVGGVLDTSHFAGAVFVGVTVDAGSELSPRQALTRAPAAAVADAMAGTLPRLGTSTTCDATSYGSLRFDAGRLEICSGGAWKLVARASATDKHVVRGVDGVRTFSDGTTPASCEAYRRPAAGYVYDGDVGDGAYRILPPGQSATAVWCDMTFDDGGWTLIGRGIGGAPAGWKDTTAAINASNAADDSYLTFKFADTFINAIPKTVYRFEGFGEVQQDWYWSGSCVYAHTSTATGACNNAYGDPELRVAQTAGVNYAGHNGMGDWTGGGQDYMHTSHSTNHWYMRSGYDDTPSDWCYAPDRGCDVRLFVR
jgi:hypothetical protein